MGVGLGECLETSFLEFLFENEENVSEMGVSGSGTEEPALRGTQSLAPPRAAPAEQAGRS